ncbi:methyltransferase type 11 [Cupriavidus sp. SK-3]|uniref:class I SAM-dependent methyltransferase n=1 Tax=Cupriavidus sp. SK-3 TaxID=1470558 RepID=UPI00045289CF|nr:class I SAM-dependent methyltransferase [Cupriavidus sp. SK-3]KDP87189.1 methyltransferase type 11 [Cupriavidus sp. SK-3]
MHICIKCHMSIAPSTWACVACGWRATTSAGVVCLAPDMAQENDGFHEPLFDEYEKLQHTHFWFVYRRKLILEALTRYFPHLMSFLDVGCGTADNLLAIGERFPLARLCGGEPSLQALQVARRKSQAQLLQMDARAIPFTNAFDVIGAFDVIEHVDEDKLVLKEMHRACADNGGIVLTVPQHPSLWSHIDDSAKHKRRYTRSDLLEKVSAAGFRPVYVTSFVSLLLPAMILSRLLQRSTRPTDGVDDGFRIGGALNRVFGGICEVERHLIKGGVRFPAGGSLLLVARKC